MRPLTRVLICKIRRLQKMLEFSPTGSETGSITGADLSIQGVLRKTSGTVPSGAWRGMGKARTSTGGDRLQMVQDQNGSSHHGQKLPAARQEMELSFLSGPRWRRQAEEKKSVLGQIGQGPGKATGGWQVFYMAGGR
jgi:hypothetical protein